MILTDTGYWYALGDRRDKHHQRALEVSLELSDDVVTTWPVVTETCYLLQKRQGVLAMSRFLTSLEHSRVDLYSIEYKHFPRINQLMHKYATLPMDLADASLVILAEHLGHGRILSTDKRDFDTYRWKNHDPFINLLLPDN